MWSWQSNRKAINKDTKTPGGLTGFSTKSNAVDRRTANAAYRASLYSHLQEFLEANMFIKNYELWSYRFTKVKNKKRPVWCQVDVIYYRGMFYWPIQLKSLTEYIKRTISNFPWALAGSVGDLKKTALLNELELDPAEPLPSGYINVIWQLLKTER